MNIAQNVEGEQNTLKIKKRCYAKDVEDFIRKNLIL
jgi:hypothetical protein